MGFSFLIGNFRLKSYPYSDNILQALTYLKNIYEKNRPDIQLPNPTNRSFNGFGSFYNLLLDKS